MGCTTSSPTKNTLQSEPSAFDDSKEAVKLVPIVYAAVEVGLKLFCKDEFVSKYTGENMFRWRACEIKTVEGDDHGRVLIHYIGWSETFDFWLDLHNEWTKVAPSELLSKQQCDQGVLLNEEQERCTFHFLTTGEFRRDLPPPTSRSSAVSTGVDSVIPPVANENSSNNKQQSPLKHTTSWSEQSPSKKGSATKSVPFSSNSDSEKHPMSTSAGYPSNSGSEKKNTFVSSVTAISTTSIAQQHVSVENPAISPPLHFLVGQQIDVQDVFYKKGSERIQLFKWRKASVLKVTPTTIRIHFENWDARYDETLHVVHDAHRLSGYDTMSSSSELCRMRDRLPQFDGSATQRSVSVVPVVEASSIVPMKDPSSRRKSSGNTLISSSSASGSPKASSPPSTKASKSISISAIDLSEGSAAVDPKGTATNKLLNWLTKYRKATTTEKTVTATEPVDEAIELENARQQKHLEALEATAEEEAEDAEQIASMERKFVATMVRKGLHVIEIEGDGNCLFRAVSHQLYLTEDHHEELRARCMKHMKAHKERFEMFCSDNFDDHIKELSVLGTWGDDLEIRALEELLDRVICIYCSDSFNLMPESDVNGNVGQDGVVTDSSAIHHAAPMKKNFEEDELVAGVAPISLSYHGQSHYNSVYNEQIPLPLAPRNTRVIMTARMELFNCVIPDSVSRLGDSPHQYASPSSAYKSHSSNRTRRSEEGDYRASTRSGSTAYSTPRKSSPRHHDQSHDADWRRSGREAEYDVQSSELRDSRDSSHRIRENQTYSTPTHSHSHSGNNANYSHNSGHSHGHNSSSNSSHRSSAHRPPVGGEEVFRDLSRHSTGGGGGNNGSYLDDEYRRKMEYLGGHKQHTSGSNGSDVKYRW